MSGSDFLEEGEFDYLTEEGGIEMMRRGRPKCPPGLRT